MGVDCPAFVATIRHLFDLEGKKAIVTGGRRGLGRAMVLGLAAVGAKVAVIARSQEADSLRKELEGLGQDLIYLPADLSVAEERQGLIERAAHELGGLDILVNNAGLQRRCAAVDYPLADWQLDLEVLLTAVFDLSQQAARLMLPQQSGKIVQVASISSFQGARQISGYATAKHGLVGLTKCLANEWAGQGVNVNAIAPGVFQTEMAGHVFADPQKTAELLGRVPAGRFGQPEDIIGPLLFLCGAASKHVHGHVMLVDGGWMGR